MITPDEIRAKAARLYSQVVSAWLVDEEIFPRTLPVNLDSSSVVSQAIAQQQTLRAQSKAVRGFGYTLQFESRRSRDYGQQDFASRVQFDTREDLLKLIGKLGEFQRLTKLVAELRARQPRLNDWLVTHWKKLVGLDGELSHLLDVVDYLIAHPRPDFFVRELPLAISTKLIEEHTGLMAHWLDELLPASSIDFSYDRAHFAGRYGFRAVDDQLWFRILDPKLLVELQCPGSELAMPRATLAALPVKDVEVIIVENKINLLTLPPRRRTVALGGLGRAVSRLFRIDWLNSLHIKYFGDIDIEGLQILAQVRNHWPQTVGLLMDHATLMEFQDLAIPGNAHQPELLPPVELTIEEQAAFNACRDHTLRLEQERIPQQRINERIAN